MTCVLVNTARVVVCPNGSAGELGEIVGGAIAWDNGVIRWVGPEADLPEAYRELPQGSLIDARKSLVIPGLVDSHTHLAFAGWREDEFARRCAGASYLDIARAGGGIRRTVEATRRASVEQLLARVLDFLQQMVRIGVTTVECKSGYGLDFDHEIKLLEVYRRAAASTPVRLVSTLLAAHVVPPEYATRRNKYIDLICRRIIPHVAHEGLARFCDVFVEQDAFTIDEARRILETGRRYGLPAKLHADQLSDMGAAELAADVEAVSADHLEQTGAAGRRAMARAGVVAVALPIASLYLREEPMAARAWIDAGAHVAVATDFNPGSAPLFDLPLAMMLACTMCGMTPAESLQGATRRAARAIGMEEEIGSLEIGKRADFVLLDAPSVDHYLYHLRPGVVRATYIGGACVYERPVA